MAVLSDKCEPVSEWPVTVALCRTELAPLSESGSAVKLEVFSAVEVAFLVEMIVDRRVDGNEFLRCSRSSEAEHSAFTSSKRQVGIVSPIVYPAARFLPIRVTNNFHRSAIGT